MWSVYLAGGTRAGGLALPDDSHLLDATGSELLIARRGLLGTTRLLVMPYELQ